MPGFRLPTAPVVTCQNAVTIEVTCFAQSCHLPAGPKLLSEGRSPVTRHSFRSLVNPGADQADLLGRERPDVCLVVRRRHPGIFVGCHVRGALDERAFRAVTGKDNLAVLAPFERVFKAVQLQFGFWFVAAVTFNAGLVEKGLMSVA